MTDLDFLRERLFWITTKTDNLIPLFEEMVKLSRHGGSIKIELVSSGADYEHIIVHSRGVIVGYLGERDDLSTKEAIRYLEIADKEITVSRILCELLDILWRTIRGQAGLAPINVSTI